MLVLLLSLLYFLVFLVRPGWGSIGWRLVWQFRVARSIHVALCVVYDSSKAFSFRFGAHCSGELRSSSICPHQRCISSNGISSLVTTPAALLISTWSLTPPTRQESSQTVPSRGYTIAAPRTSSRSSSTRTFNAPYKTNTQELTKNSADSILETEADTTDPFVEYVYLGKDATDGIFAWISIRVNAA
ncbi:hypothetical protein AFLA_009608 [Aspergillus flavus NRRL3357]|nr:hypothetical protein AFLA_009608 [Aspergillus flavus NRRL3357]